MTLKEYKETAGIDFTPVIQQLYGLEGYTVKAVDRGYEICDGQNAVFFCEKEGENAKVLRLSLNERSREDLLAEAEFVRYLYENGGGVSDVVTSVNGNLVEEFCINSHACRVTMFEKAKGKQFSENNYVYREGAPITEYYSNIGKTLGKIHRLSKEYEPIHRRSGFADKYNPGYVNELIPDSFPVLKGKLRELLNELNDLGHDREIFGMIHFDYNDSNYSIDFESGCITVYDFDDSCFGWYMFDVAYAWMYAVGIAQSERSPEKRRERMEEFLRIVVEGYRSETGLEERLLEKLPFFIDIVALTLIVEAFEYIRANHEEPEYDFELSYLIKCIEDGIPYIGFYGDIYSHEAPFEYEDGRIGLLTGG